MFKVVEKFVSINGEGTKCGELAVFIRFQKCNLQCSYCDTQWACTEDAPYEEMAASDLVAYVLETGVKNVTLTGGEPLLQENLDHLLLAFSDAGIGSVEIETNGSCSMQPFYDKAYRPAFTVDYKLPSSGMETHMHLENYARVTMADTVKFVCGSYEDLQRAGQIIRKYRLIEKTHVYFSPVFGQITPAEIVDFMVDEKLNGVKLQLQMHKFIWDPNERGV